LKPAVFDYYKPKTIDEALSLLDRFGQDAKIISGGQSLIPMMNMRLARPEVVIDINGLNELSYIRFSDSQMQIGGLTRHYMIEESAALKKACPMLSEGIKWVGHSQIRSLGTIGGSLVHADPTAELPVILTALDGQVKVLSSEGERVITPDEFFLTYMTTTIQPNEILVEVTLPQIPARTGHAIDEFALRRGDFAIVLAAASVTLDEEGKIAKASLCLGGVDGVPVKLDQVTAQLIGEKPEDGVIASCCEAIESLIEPESDIHASGEYRRDLSVTLSRRVLKRAAERAAIAAPSGG